MSKLQVLLTLTLLVATAKSQADHCHFCSSERDGLPCEEPIDSSRIQVQRCSDLEVASNLESLPAFDNSTSNTQEAQVCISISYTYFDRTVFIRGCDAAEATYLSMHFDDICNYYYTIYPSYLTNFTCTSCEGDLCNAVRPVQITEEGDDEKPSSADIMSISARFIIIMALALIML
ncbi:uncharacterized protein LOC115877773 [Sitophilus oryzae]|uniref:Uncharacterized protein LOC115877773 n=1 Tax=Sitophilus oryzae TaxID=7048 RepID=A0A6J2XF24_SITOR|nr:uncharacterized protein LOC115877773 [Sitophilus oryzae]